MDRPTFERVFADAVRRAADGAEARFGRPVGRLFCIRLGAFSPYGTLISAEGAVDQLWIDDDHFFLIIDVAITATDGERTEVFIRPSGHEPRSWEATWNPLDLGPFKILDSYTLEAFPSAELP